MVRALQHKQHRCMRELMGIIGHCPPRRGLFILQGKWRDVPNLKCPKRPSVHFRAFGRRGAASCGGFLHPASSYRGHGLHPLSPWAVSSHLPPTQLLPLMEIVRCLGPDRVSTAVLVGRVGRQRKCLCVEKEGSSFSAPTWSQYFCQPGAEG